MRLDEQTVRNKSSKVSARVQVLASAPMQGCVLVRASASVQASASTKVRESTCAQRQVEGQRSRSPLAEGIIATWWMIPPLISSLAKNLIRVRNGECLTRVSLSEQFRKLYSWPACLHCIGRTQEYEPSELTEILRQALRSLLECSMGAVCRKCRIWPVCVMFTQTGCRDVTIILPNLHPTCLPHQDLYPHLFLSLQVPHACISVYYFLSSIACSTAAAMSSLQVTGIAMAS